MTTLTIGTAVVVTGQGWVGTHGTVISVGRYNGTPGCYTVRTDGGKVLSGVYPCQVTERANETGEAGPGR